MSERGTSLLETTLALALGSLVVTAATSELRSAMAVLSRARHVDDALSAARAALDHALAEPCGTLSQIGRDCPSELRCTAESSELSTNVTASGVTRIVRLEISVSRRAQPASSPTRLVTIVRRPEPCGGPA